MAVKCVPGAAVYEAAGEPPAPPAVDYVGFMGFFFEYDLQGHDK